MGYSFAMKSRFLTLLLLPLTLSSCGGSSIVEYSFKPYEKRTLDIHYSDTLFDKPSTTADVRLASTAMSMAFLAGCWEDQEVGPTYYIHQFYEKAGMEKEFFANYDHRATPGEVAYSLASKKLTSGKNLIWGAIRSDFYYGEWADNFNIGLEGDVYGFRVPAEKVYGQIKQYVIDNAIAGETVLFLCGLSRGASVATLVGSMIDDDIANGVTYGQASISLENTYVYGIETPAPSIKTDYGHARYQNIHNYFNMNDLLAYLPWRSWGFHTLGQNHYYSDRLTDIRYSERRNRLIEVMKKTGGESFSYPDNVLVDPSDSKTDAYPSYGRQGNLLINADDPPLIASRQEYVEKYQDAMMWLATFIFDDERSIYLGDTLKSHMLSFLGKTRELTSALDALREKDYETLKNTVLSVCDEIIEDDGKTHAILLDIFVHCAPLLDLCSDLLIAQGEDFNPLSLMTLATPMIAFHRSSVTGWLFAFDGNHGYELDEEGINDGSYYRLEVGSLTAFTLSLKGGEKLFEASGREIVSSSLSAEIRNGILSLYLPKNGQYEYEAASISYLSLYDVEPVTCKETRLKTSMPLTGTI